MAVLLVWGGFLLAEKVYTVVQEQREEQRRATLRMLQQMRRRDDEERQLAQPRLLSNEDTSDWTGPPPPPEYICPISLSLMTDPVMIETGMTFDRQSITHWFARGRKSCPLTNRPLQSTGLCPNTRLAKDIAAWRDESSKGQSPKSSLDELISQIQAEQSRRKRMLPRVSSGAYPASPRTSHMSCQAHDMAHDLNISMEDLSSDKMLGNLVSLLRVPTVCPSAAGMLAYAAKQDVCDRLRVVREGALEAVKDVLTDAASPDDAVVAVCGLLKQLSNDSNVKIHVLEENIPEALLALLATSKDSGVQVAAGDALQALLGNASASILLALRPQLPKLQELAADESRATVRLYAVEAIGYMAMNDEVAEELVDDGLIMQLLILISDLSKKQLVNKATFAIYCLSMHSRTLPKLLTFGAIDPLVHIIEEGQVAAQGYAAGGLLDAVTVRVGTLMYLALHVGSRGAIAASGAPEPLIKLLASNSRRCQGHAAGALGCLCGSPRIVGLIGAKGGIVPLVRMLDSQDEWLQELAMDTLATLIRDSLNNQRRFLDAGGLGPLVRLLDMQDVSSYSIAAALSTVAVLARHRIVKETLYYSDGFMSMCRRMMNHGDEDVRAAARQAVEVMTLDPNPVIGLGTLL